MPMGCRLTTVAAWGSGVDESCLLGGEVSYDRCVFYFGGNERDKGSPKAVRSCGQPWNLRF